MSNVSQDDDLERALDGMREGVRPAWSAKRQDAIVAEGVRRARREVIVRRRVRRISAGISALLLLLAVSIGGWSWRRGLTHTNASDPSAGELAHVINLREGSVITLADANSEVRVTVQDSQRVVAELRSGGARFDVVHLPDRLFRVEIGAVAVQVLGTIFEVERVGERVRVSVGRGSVRVFWNDQFADLHVDENGLFPRELIDSSVHATATAEDPAVDASVIPETPDASSRGVSTSTRTRVWSSLAQDGEYEAAYRSLRREGTSSVRDEAGDLFLAADVARYSGHPNDAVAPLRRIISSHSHDARAPLASFTLGRLLLEDLGRPREAADAFHRAEELEPNGSVAQDALAREVEAASRAGDSARARERAERYVRQYPAGRRIRPVRRFGGLE